MEMRKPAPAVSENEQPDQESWNVRLMLSDSGKSKTLLEARHAGQYRQGEKQEIRIDGGLALRLFNDGGTSTLITAEKGIVHGNQDIEAFNHVVIRTENGTEIRTEYIMRSNLDRMMRSDRFVTINSPSGSIRGYGFESDDAMKSYRIFHASGEALAK
jgi:LPS export ABC transporter protein LptC